MKKENVSSVYKPCLMVSAELFTIRKQFLYLLPVFTGSLYPCGFSQFIPNQSLEFLIRGHVCNHKIINVLQITISNGDH